VEDVADQEREFAVALRAVATQLRRVQERQEGVEPITQSEVDVLVHVLDHPGATVTEVARELGRQSSNVSATVRSLVQRSLLVREADSSDARRSLLTATPLAAQGRARLDAAWSDMVTEWLHALPAADRRAVVRATPALRALADADVASAPAARE